MTISEIIRRVEAGEVVALSGQDCYRFMVYQEKYETKDRTGWVVQVDTGNDLCWIFDETQR